MSSRIVFTTPWIAPHEAAYLQESLHSGLTSGDGPFTDRAVELLRPLVGGGACLLTTSCTHALEMTGLLLDLGPGDEVILPSFTFVSTVNAFVLRGATPVFADIDQATFNVDPARIEESITPRTRAIVVVHYAGVACDMTAIGAIAARHGIPVIEDNAHGLGGSLHGQPLGSFGALATQSFHVTKNVSCGEGGALVLNDTSLLERAEIIREKGTNRSQFFRGMVDKYRWVDRGSSYLPSDLLAAALTAQLEAFDEIQRRRQGIWSAYSRGLADWARASDVRTQHIPDGCVHPAHMFALLMPTAADRIRFISELGAQQIGTPFHYVPLHLAPIAQELGRTAGCPVTEDVAARLVRLPLHAGMTPGEIDRVVTATTAFVTQPA